MPVGAADDDVPVGDVILHAGEDDDAACISQSWFVVAGCGPQGRGRTLFAGELRDKVDGVLEALPDAVDAFRPDLASRM